MDFVINATTNRILTLTDYRLRKLRQFKEQIIRVDESLAKNEVI
jgi:hypothetical protein